MLPDGARFMDCGTGQLWTGVAIIVLHSPAIPHLIMNDTHVYAESVVYWIPRRLEGYCLSSDHDITLINYTSK